MAFEQFVAQYTQPPQRRRDIRLPAGFQQRRRGNEDVACTAEDVEPFMPHGNIELADDAGHVLDRTQ